MKKVGLTHSFSTRVSLCILLATGAIFAIAFIIFYHSARILVKDESIKHAEAALSNTILQIDNVLHSIEVAVDNMAWIIPEHISEPDSMYSVVHRLLENNPIIMGSTVAFEPHYYPAKGSFYSPYAYRQNDSIFCMQLGSVNYDYHHMDWYQIPKLLDTAYWSEPYYDDGGGEMIMSTYSLPMYDIKGDMYAIFTADISLKWLTEMVNSLKIYPNSYNLMIGRSGTYLAHPFPERILDETIFTATLDMEDSSVMELGRQMVEGKQGNLTLHNDDSLSTSYVFYAPIERTGWSVAVVCTHKDVFAGVDDIRTVVLIIAGIGLFMLLVFCIYIIRQLTNPLTRLADSTLSIASGNLNTPLPPIKRRNDEMGKLYASFDFMQRSLSDHIKELEITTAKKERIESELRIASEIQMGMIPKVFPPFPDRDDIDIFAILVPAKEVGGDLYDFFIEEGKLYFTIGDVSGKGVPASLLMAVTRSLFRTMASYLRTPSAIVSSLNDSISETNHSAMFVTLFLGILDLKTGALRYCNAGHNAPILINTRNEAAFMDIVPNLPLGVFTGFPYQEQETILTPGSWLFSYTDGVTEAENYNQELFSDERLLEIIKRQQQMKPADRVRDIVRQVQYHASGAEQNDDITMLCLHYASDSIQ